MDDRTPTVEEVRAAKLIVSDTRAALEAEARRQRWKECPACGCLVLMSAGAVHPGETLRSECQGPHHAP